ncbi:hypothetical protein BC938DRAFT_475144 [Jimgerdemannia flammicorona]|uniref:Uncharacterized protein n=1 Tax=Jimgerdemannia flammicorona TaxID=994334 RepID=A0A433PZR8_9FUNG|nr:hypothetical protein BC938DRAFT_475144 [Jimgerdemannia flammicorona]
MGNELSTLNYGIEGIKARWLKRKKSKSTLSQPDEGNRVHEEEQGDDSGSDVGVCRLPEHILIDLKLGEGVAALSGVKVVKARESFSSDTSTNSGW